MVRYLVDLPTTNDELVNLIEIIVAQGLDPEAVHVNPATHFLLIQMKLGKIAGYVQEENVSMLVEEIINLSSECIRWINSLYTEAEDVQSNRVEESPRKQ